MSVGDNLLELTTKFFTGRAKELGEIDKAVDNYIRGRGPNVILIAGPKGVGKTSFINYVIRTRFKPFFYNYIRVDVRVHKSWLLVLKKIRDVLNNKFGFITPNFDAYINELRRKAFEDLVGINITALESGIMFFRSFLRDSVFRAFNIVSRRFPDYLKEFDKWIGEATSYEIARFSPLALAMDIESELKRHKERLIIIIDHFDELDDVNPILAFMTILSDVLFIILVSDENVISKISELVKNTILIRFDSPSLDEVKGMLKKIVKNESSINSIIKKAESISKALFLAFLNAVNAKNAEELPVEVKEELSIIFRLPYFYYDLLSDNLKQQLPLLFVLADEEDGIIIPSYREELPLSLDKFKEIEKTLQENYPELRIKLLYEIDPKKSLSEFEERVRNSLISGDVLTAIKLAKLFDVEFKGASEKIRFESSKLMALRPLISLQVLDELLKEADYLKEADIISYLEFLSSYIFVAIGHSLKRMFDILDGYRASKEFRVYVKILEGFNRIASIINNYGRLELLDDLEKSSRSIYEAFKKFKKVEKEAKEHAKRMFNEILVKLARTYYFIGDKEKARSIINEVDLSSLNGIVRLDALILKEMIVGNNFASLDQALNGISEHYDKVFLRPRSGIINLLKASRANSPEEKLGLLDQAIADFKAYNEILGWQYIDILLELGEAYKERANVLSNLKRPKESISSAELAVDMHKLAVNYTKETLAEAYILLINSYLTLLSHLEKFGKKQDIIRRSEELLNISEGIMDRLLKAKIFSSKGVIENIIYNLARAYINMSDILIRSGDLKKALERATAAVDVFERLGYRGKEKDEAFLAVGKILLRMGRYSEAYSYLNKSESNEAFIWKAEVLRRSDKLADIAKELKDAREKFSGFYKGVAIYYLAEILQDELENEEILPLINESYKMVMEDRDIKDWSFFANRIVTFLGKIMERQRELREAIMRFNEARDIIRDNVEKFEDPLYLSAFGHTLYSLGKAYLKLRDFERAELELRKAAEYLISALKIADWKDPYALGVFVLVHTNLARALIRIGKKNEAKISIEEAIKQGKNLISLISTKRSYVYYSRALIEACRLYLRLRDLERVKEYLKELKVVVRKELEMQKWRDVIMLDAYISILEDLKKYALNEFTDYLKDELRFLVDNLYKVINEIEKSNKNYPRFLELFGRATTLVADILWKQTLFDEAYKFIDRGIETLKEKILEIPEEKRIYVKIHLFNMMVMKSTMKYFAEGDIETLENFLGECEEIAKEVDEKLKEHPERLRMLADVEILKARKEIFIKDYEKTLEHLKKAKEIIEEMRKVNKMKASRYGRIIIKIVNYALTGRKLPPNLAREYITLKRELKNIIF